MKTSSVVHSVHAPVPQLDEEHQREAEHREHLVAHEHGGTRAPAGWGHVLLLAGDTWLTCVSLHLSGETDGAGEVDHVSRISVCVPSQKMAQKQFSILQNIQIRLSD